MDSKKSSMSKYRRAVFGFIGIVAACLIYQELRTRPSFSRDLNVYSITHRLYEQKRDPYDLSLLEREWRETLGGDTEIKYPALAIPIVFVYLKPIWLLDLELAQWIWYWLQIVMIVMMMRWSWRLLGRPEMTLYDYLVLVLFYPCIHPSLIMGQISTLPIWGFFGFVHYYINHKYRLAGAFLALTVVKPLLFMPVYGLLAVEVFYYHRRKFLPVSLFVILGGWLLLEMQYPNAMIHYLKTLYHLDLNIIFASLTSLIIFWLQKLFHQVYAWPNWVFPILASSYFVGRYSRSFNVDLVRILPSLVCWSVITSPYVWTYDFSILVFVHMAIWFHVTRASEKGMRRWGRWFFLGFIIFIWHASAKRLYVHEFYWIPLGYFILWAAAVQGNIIKVSEISKKHVEQISRKAQQASPK